MSRLFPLGNILYFFGWHRFDPCFKYPVNNVNILLYHDEFIYLCIYIHFAFSLIRYAEFSAIQFSNLSYFLSQVLRFLQQVASFVWPFSDFYKFFMDFRTFPHLDFLSLTASKNASFLVREPIKVILTFKILLAQFNTVANTTFSFFQLHPFYDKPLFQN